jgi:hypothetical protein
MNELWEKLRCRIRGHSFELTGREVWTLFELRCRRCRCRFVKSSCHSCRVPLDPHFEKLFELYESLTKSGVILSKPKAR